MELKPSITVVLEQSTREQGAMTKKMVKYKEVSGGGALRTVYVSQAELKRAFGRFPQKIHVMVSDADDKPLQGASGRTE